MKQILQKGIILFISVLICLFVSCFPHPPEPVPPEPPEVIVEPPAPGQGSVSRSTSISLETLDWNTYVAGRKAEGYKLLDVRESAAWLQQNKQDISINTGSNYQYNIRSVTTLTTIYTTQAGSHKDIVLIVNDDAGNLRVFQK